ncbi:MAG: class I SAM-dependent methyltransferase [Planctomycetota bacterium]
MIGTTDVQSFATTRAARGAACRLCGAPEPRLLHSFSTVSVDQCSTCGFVHVREQPREAELVEMYGPDYFDRGKYSDPVPLAKENARRMRLLDGCGLARGARVLDAGCATGDFIAFAGDGYEMWGMDISEFAVEEARRKTPAAASRIRTGLVEDRAYPSGYFDAIVLWDVLEHLWDPVTTLRLLLESLRPGGYFIVSTPNIGAPVARMMGKRWAFMTVPEHLGLFSRGTITRLLEARLHLQCVRWMTKGKWVNAGFLTYKLRRVFPRLVPAMLVHWMRTGWFRRVSLYVPTGDIQYCVARKASATIEHP